MPWLFAALALGGLILWTKGKAYFTPGPVRDPSPQESASLQDVLNSTSTAYDAEGNPTIPSTELLVDDDAKASNGVRGTTVRVDPNLPQADQDKMEQWMNIPIGSDWPHVVELATSLQQRGFPIAAHAVAYSLDVWLQHQLEQAGATAAT